jgi:capsular exopolysaccharide synthesis family protein
MSHIFDALQRSEASRTKSEVPLSLPGIELLEATEREAASQWMSETVTQHSSGPEIEHANLLFGHGGRKREASAADALAVTDALPIEDFREYFSQFQTLKVSAPQHSPLVCLTDVDSPAAEAFRLLGVRLRHLRTAREFKSLLITSAIPQEGKSMVAANLACTLASGAQQRVLLLEGDVRRPSLAQLFELPSVAGLCNCLKGERNLIASLYRLEGPGFWFLPAGDKPASPLELIQSPQLPALMHKLNSWFDWIVIDSPPALPFADTSVWTRLSDGILLVARRGTSEKRKLEKALEALDRTKLIGAVLNSSNSTVDGDYYYYRRAPGA